MLKNAGRGPYHDAPEEVRPAPTTRRRTRAGLALLAVGVVTIVASFLAPSAGAAPNPNYQGDCVGTATSGTCVLDEPEGNDPAVHGTVIYNVSGDVITFTINALGNVTGVQICMQTSGPFDQAANSCAGAGDPQVTYTQNGNQYSVDFSDNGFNDPAAVFWAVHVNIPGRTLLVRGPGSLTQSTTTTTTTTTAPTTTSTSTTTTAPTTTTTTTAPTTTTTAPTTTTTTTATRNTTTTTAAPGGGSVGGNTATTTTAPPTGGGPPATNAAPQVLGEVVTNPDVAPEPRPDPAVAPAASPAPAGQAAPVVEAEQVNAQTLPRTGADPVPLLLLAGVCLVMGGLVLLAGRPPKRHATRARG